jgi:hypothetical protein
MSNELALYTTVYPGAERFLSSWYESLVAQTDHDFDLYIGTDQIEPRAVFGAVGNEFEAVWIAARTCSTPASVRQAGIDHILGSANRYQGIVFVDCDDVMYATRVESARIQLQNSDIAGCALEIVQEDDQPTGLFFGPVVAAAIPQMLATVNVFGMSNTAYRTHVLREIPPSPPQCRLMDWFIATAGWIRGARFSFDNTPRMKYRQYENNTARVLSPFTTEYIRLATGLVLEHYELVLSHIPGMSDGIRGELESARANVQLFSSRIAEFPYICERYVLRLNKLPASHFWWDCVAHPALEDQWKS